MIEMLKNEKFIKQERFTKQVQSLLKVSEPGQNHGICECV